MLSLIPPSPLIVRQMSAATATQQDDQQENAHRGAP